MKPSTRISEALVLRSVRRPAIALRSPSLIAGKDGGVGPITYHASSAAIHSDSPKPANVVPVYGTGPPPDAPVPAAEHVNSRVARRRKQAEMLHQAKELRASSAGGSGSKAAASGNAGFLRKRFWRDVHVREVDGAYEVHLDTRPLRRPNNKEIVRIPLTKPHLAHAVALEWDIMASAQQATKHHNIPLTSLVCRALDIADDDAAHAQGQATTSSENNNNNSSSSSSNSSSTPPEPSAPIRASIATTVLRYLDTDTLLCLSPGPDPANPASPASALDANGRSLRAVQEDAYRRVTSYLSSRVWPGVELRPVLDDDGSILPRGQRPGVREVVQGWVSGLAHWELAGLERATLAGKGLLGAARLVAEWSEADVGVVARGGLRGLTEAGDEGNAGGDTALERFGVEEAARTASIEVDWQIGRWGEVEDTHDVEKQDIRRQLGSVVLLVSGTGSSR